MVSQSTLWVATAILAASTVDARVCRYYNGQYYDQYGKSRVELIAPIGA